MRTSRQLLIKFTSKRLFLLVAAAAFFCAGFYVWEQSFEPIYRFKVAIPGYLYQSGQPEPSNLGRYIEKYGFRAILYLRTHDRRWERQMADDLGVKLIRIRIDARNHVSKEWFDSLYRILSDETNYPMLVHCHAGKNRSSIVVAFHRVKFEHWPLESAIEEMVENGFNQERYSKSLHSLRGFFLPDMHQSKLKPEKAEIAIAPATRGE